MSMKKLGFKQLAIDNWNEPDETASFFHRLSDDGSKILSGEDWLEIILKPKLEEQVPDEIHALFEATRGALVYGYFFYPLYTLGGDHLYRVAEAAVTHKYEAMTGQKKRASFKTKLQYLIDKRVIPENTKDDWDTLRQFRNHVSHLKRQDIYLPFTAINALTEITDLINALFSNRDTS